MIDQNINAHIYEIVVAVLVWTLMLGAGIWWFLLRPSGKKIQTLQQQLSELSHSAEITRGEHLHQINKLEETASRYADELNNTRAGLKEQNSVNNRLAEELASAKEKIKQFEHLQSAHQRLQQQVIELSADKARLESDLKSERAQLAKQLELLENAKQEIKKEFELTANKLFERKSEQFSQASQNVLELTLTPFKSQIEAFRKKVEDVYEKENAERNKLAGQIIELQKQARKIGEDAVNLAQALKGSNKSQGGWGEVILERLLEQSGLQKGREYETQFQVKDEQGQKKIPDVVVHLPEGKDIVVDAKVSLTDYGRYCSADSEAARQKYLQAHISSIRGHVRNLSAKDYEKLPGIRSLDFVFIFIPIEAAFMLALQNDTTLYSDAYNKNIILASPTTLLAMLRTIENLWRNDKQNRNAEKIAKEAGALHDQFVLLLEALDEVGKGLNRTQKAYNLVNQRLHEGRGNLMRKVDGIRKLGAKTKKVLPENHIKALNESIESDETDE